MPTETKTATKRATKKRRVKRVASEDPSEVEKPKARTAKKAVKKKTTAKKTTTKKTTKTAAAKKAAAKKTTSKSAVSKKAASRKTTKKTTKVRSAKVTTDDDFGSGLIEDDAPAKKAVKKKRKVAKKTASSSRRSSDDAADEKPAAKKRKVARKTKKAVAGDDFGAELDFGDGDTSTRESASRSSSGRSSSSRSSAAIEKSADREPAESREPRRERSSRSGDDDRPSRPQRSRGRRSSEEKASSSRDTDDLSFDAPERSETAESSSGESGGRAPRSGEEASRDGDSSDSRRGRRRRGRRGRGRRGRGGEGEERDRGPRSNQRGGAGGNKRGRDNNRERGPSIEPVSTHVVGVLELHPKGYGFVRSQENDYAAQETDPFVSTAFIERYNLREGVLLEGEVGSGHRGQGPRLTSVTAIEGKDPELYVDIKDFDRLTPINPEEHIKLEMGKSPITTRVIDLLCPIGKGQRALIVAPPRSGKTILLQQMADAVAFNHPECHLMVMLIDERPEEVTEMRRHVKGEVIASSIDRDLENHVRVSQLVIERAKRLAEQGKDVFILLDSITRLARAFNKYTNTGRTGSGGIDVRAMDKPKKIFGSARVFDEGGSITVVGTALIQTGSRMDDVIFEEFKGTGNMELVLSRELADRRIWPAMDIEKSGTRREEKLLSPETLEGVTMMRRSLISLHPAEAMEQLIRTLSKFETNTEFLSRIRSVM